MSYNATMKKSGLVLLLVLPALFAWKSPSPDFPPHVKTKELYAKNDFRGKEFKTLEFGQVLKGKVPAKEDLKGKVLLIDFWATWCPPCRELIPEMNEWKKKFGDDLIMIGVSDEKSETVEAFMKKTPMEYTVTVDSTKKMSKQVGVAGIPHVLVISQDGIVRYQGFPLDEKDKLSTEKMAQIIEANKALK
jgi:cytochrome c biogenesis protein CcmG/thiol:disulfide interchange protein DsbE